MPIHHSWHEFWRYLAPFQHFFYIVAGLVVIASRRCWQKILETRAAGWPSADGVVQAAMVRTHNGSWVEVEYRYYAMQ